MSELLRVALAQMNAKVGDIEGNAAKITDLTARAREGDAELVVFPELALTGYPPEDLLLKTSFLDAAAVALEGLAAQTRGIVAVVGFPQRADDVYNAAAVLADGAVAAVYRKVYLPNYGVFDEQRYFQSGSEALTFEVNGIPVGDLRLRGHLGAGPPRDVRGPGRSAGAREPVGLAVPARIRHHARADARAACRGLPGGGRVREHRRRPGRARLRRPQRGREPRRHGAGALPAVRGVARVLHDRPRRGRGGAPARHPPPRERARQRRRPPSFPSRTARASGRTRRRSTRWRRRGPGAGLRGGRSTRRFAPGCATTSRRTASSTSCSASPAGSTPRSWR